MHAAPPLAAPLKMHPSSSMTPNHKSLSGLPRLLQTIGVLAEGRKLAYRDAAHSEPVPGRTSCSKEWSAVLLADATSHWHAYCHPHAFYSNPILSIL